MHSQLDLATWIRDQLMYVCILMHQEHSATYVYQEARRWNNNSTQIGFTRPWLSSYIRQATQYTPVLYRWQWNTTRWQLQRLTTISHSQIRVSCNRPPQPQSIVGWLLAHQSHRGLAFRSQLSHQSRSLRFTQPLSTFPVCYLLKYVALRLLATLYIPSSLRLLHNIGFTTGA